MNVGKDIKMQVPIAKPHFGEAEKEAVARVLESGWVVQGPRVAEFEKKPKV